MTIKKKFNKRIFLFFGFILLIVYLLISNNTNKPVENFQTNYNTNIESQTICSVDDLICTDSDISYQAFLGTCEENFSSDPNKYNRCVNYSMGSDDNITCSDINKKKYEMQAVADVTCT